MMNQKSGQWQVAGSEGQVIAYLRDNVVGLVKTMRPRQWVKNGFVLAALLFDADGMLPLLVKRAATDLKPCSCRKAISFGMS